MTGRHGAFHITASGVRQKKGFGPVKSMKGATEFQRGRPAGSLSNTHGLDFALPKNIPWCNDNPHDQITLGKILRTARQKRLATNSEVKP
jgi:hypothetical protein